MRALFGIFTLILVPAMGWSISVMPREGTYQVDQIVPSMRIRTETIYITTVEGRERVAEYRSGECLRIGSDRMKCQRREQVDAVPDKVAQFVEAKYSDLQVGFDKPAGEPQKVVGNAEYSQWYVPQEAKFQGKNYPGYILSVGPQIQKIILAKESNSAQGEEFILSDDGTIRRQESVPDRLSSTSFDQYLIYLAMDQVHR